MQKKDALKLSPGDKLRYKPTGQEVTVVGLRRSADGQDPKGNYPLVVTREMGPVSYLLLLVSTEKSS